ncbi:SigE family RNA polymerase sigma factor [Catenulispora subtropica]|uniref:RNA polymerase sigma factor n=1 Tax=Catenulispora subtropica TaxID=450798 RepID=A0ABP5ECH7_9ACTN
MADDSEFDDFYRGTSHRLLQYAYAMTGDLGTAQDLVQEAYIRAWQRWSRVRGYDQPESWLRMVVQRMATDRWRRLGVARRARAAGAWEPGPAAPAPSENTVVLVRALRGLREAERRALVLHYLLDLPVTDIAVETGAPVGTVKSWLSRGRAALAAELEGVSHAC